MGFASLWTNHGSLFIVGGNERPLRGGCWWGKKSKNGGKESDWRERENTVTHQQTNFSSPWWKETIRGLPCCPHPAAIQQKVLSCFGGIEQFWLHLSLLPTHSVY